MATGKNRFKFFNGLIFLKKYVHNSDEGLPKCKVIWTKHIDRFWKKFIITFSVLYMSYNSILFGSIYAYYHDNVRSTPMGIHLPYFERDSDTEFLASMTLQGIVSIYVILGNFLAELTKQAVTSTLELITDLIRFNLEELHDEFALNENSLRSKSRILNVFNQIEDFIKYVAA